MGEFPEGSGERRDYWPEREGFSGLLQDPDQPYPKDSRDYP